VSAIDIQSLTKMYYSIGELSKLLGVNASLLRFWEKEFNLKVSKRNKKGNRLYSVKEIEKISQIFTLVKVNGYTLDGAKKALKSKAKVPVKPDEKVVVIAKLNDIKKRLTHLKS
jgi:DNA-binding transcriptional MerR regulator